MEYKFISKPAFSVIGKQGSTRDGEGFIQRLWQSANENFPQVAPLAKKTPDGSSEAAGFAGFWGLMSDESMGFKPWEDGFTRGLYLAGVEVEDSAQAPDGWVKWTAPAREYLVAPAGPEAFRQALAYIEEQGWDLAGAVYDFTDPKTGEASQYFPIDKPARNEVLL